MPSNCSRTAARRLDTMTNPEAPEWVVEKMARAMMQDGVWTSYDSNPETMCVGLAQAAIASARPVSRSRSRVERLSAFGRLSSQGLDALSHDPQDHERAADPPPDRLRPPRILRLSQARITDAVGLLPEGQALCVAAVTAGPVANDVSSWIKIPAKSPMRPSAELGARLTRLLSSETRHRPYT